VLVPRGTWPDGDAYDAQAKKLAGMFRDNFSKFAGASEAIRDAGPKG
jgi:phosphoenolpyruvate carboxykinase (ATP)